MISELFCFIKYFQELDKQNTMIVDSLEDNYAADVDKHDLLLGKHKQLSAGLSDALQQLVTAFCQTSIWSPLDVL